MVPRRGSDANTAKALVIASGSTWKNPSGDPQVTMVGVSILKWSFMTHDLDDFGVPPF